jgi:hypothetical protein
VRRQLDVAEGIGEPGHGEAAVEHVEQAALHDDAEIAIGRAERLVEPVVDDELARRGQAPLDLVGFLAERGRRMAQPLVVEGCRLDRVLSSALNRSKEPSFGGRDEPPIILIEIAWQGGSRNFGPWLDPGDAKARRCRMPPLVETINGAENGAEKSRSLSQFT